MVPKICSIDGCDRRHYAKSYCQSHYNRVRDTGVEGPAVGRKPRARRTPDEALRHRGWVVAESGCWEWSGASSKGRAWISQGQEMVPAYRLAYEAWVGPIPEGIYVCHHCDNPLCINPDHLFLGTHDDNMADMTIKGRSTHGKRNGQAKLSPEQVRAIPEMVRAGKTQSEIGRMFGVSRSAIALIVQGRRWVRETSRPAASSR